MYFTVIVPLFDMSLLLILLDVCFSPHPYFKVLFSFHPFGHDLSTHATLISRWAVDPAAALGYSRTGTLPQPHPQLHPRLSSCCGGL